MNRHPRRRRRIRMRKIRRGKGSAARCWSGPSARCWGLAAEAFERDAVAEAEAEVNTELIRRVRDMRVTAAKLETLGEEEDDENADENAEDDARKNEQDDTQAPKADVAGTRGVDRVRASPPA
jgi:hypothetical protein